MDIELRRFLQDSVKGTHLDQVGLGSQEQLQWALSLNPEDLVVLPVEDISKAIFIYAQYIVFVQAQLNVREASLMYEKRKFNRAVAKAISKYPKGTVAEREAKAFEDNEDLRMLEQQYLKAQTNFVMFQKMPDSMAEVVNALKKELTRRTGGSKLGL